MREPLLSLSHITMDFPGVRALDDVGFDLHAGEVHALVGENGAGKSTFIKIIAGVWPYGSYRGEIRLDGREVRFHHVWESERHQIRVIHQELSLVNELSVAENILLGHEPTRHGRIDSVQMIVQAQQALDRLNAPIRPEQKVGELTVGQQQLVEIAKALSQKARILVFDEPTAALPEQDVQNLLALIRDLRRQGIGIIYISHKLNEVEAIADRVTVLRNGRKVGEFRQGEYQTETLIRAMLGRTLESAFPPLARPREEELLRVEGLTLYHPEQADRTILRDIRFDCRRGEVLGIAGLLGSGRTALLSLLFGAFRGQWQGAIHFAGRPYAPRTPEEALRCGIALVTEDRKRYGLFPTADVAENLSMASLPKFCQGYRLRPEKLLRACQRYVDRLAIKTPSLRFLASKLSGGNQQKLILGRFLMQQPQLLLLDDPTRGIDVGAKYEIYRLIQELAREGMGILFVSSELPEVLGVSHRVIVLREGRVCDAFSHGERNEMEVLALAAGVRRGENPTFTIG